MTKAAFEGLEPYDGKLSCTVLKGERGRETPDLPGVDLNLNFPYIIDTNPNPPEKETDAIMNLCQQRHFVLSADFHAGAEFAIYPWGRIRDHIADESWYVLTCKQWADLAHENSPAGYFDDFGGYSNYNKTNGSITPPLGTFIDYVQYFQQCRDIKAEISSIKILSPAQLIPHWNYQKASFLAYL